MGNKAGKIVGGVVGGAAGTVVAGPVGGAAGAGAGFVAGAAYDKRRSNSDSDEADSEEA